MSVIKVRGRERPLLLDRNVFVDRDGDLLIKTIGSPSGSWARIYSAEGTADVYNHPENGEFAPYKPVRIISIEVEEI